MVTRVIDNRANEELAIEAQDAPEPGDLPSSLKDEDVSSVVTLESTGWRYVWDTRTGERSRVPRDLVLNALKKKRADGSRVFTTDPQGLPAPRRGTLPCLLHADHPDRAYHDTLGLPVCNKKLMTALDVRRHAQHRHKNEWDSIQEDRRLRMEEEERLVRRSIIANSAPKAAPEPVSAAAPVPHAGAAVSSATEDCEKCGGTITAKSRKGLHFARVNHRKVCTG